VITGYHRWIIHHRVDPDQIPIIVESCVREVYPVQDVVCHSFNQFSYCVLFKIENSIVWANLLFDDQKMVAIFSSMIDTVAGKNQYAEAPNRLVSKLKTELNAFAISADDDMWAIDVRKKTGKN